MISDESDSENKEKQAKLAEPCDWFLRETVGLANEDVSARVTLSVGGILVSGVVIGLSEYFEGIAREAADEIRRFDDEAADATQDTIRAWKDVYPDDEVETIAFIHLKDAQFIIPGAPPVPMNKGVYWRGRLSRIDGFSFGILSYSRE